METKKQEARRLIERAREIAESDAYKAGEAEASEHYLAAVADARTMSKLAEAEAEAALLEERASADDEANQRAKALLDAQPAPEAAKVGLRDKFEEWDRGGRSGKFQWVAYPDRSRMSANYVDYSRGRDAVVEGRTWYPTSALIEQRADIINETGNSGGAYVWKTENLDQIVMHENAASGVLQAGPRIIQTPDDHAITIPTFATDATAGKTAEGTEATAGEPVFAQATLNSYRIDVHFHVGNETLRSASIPLESVLADACARSLATQEANYLAYGTGSSQPQGLSGHATATTANTKVTAAYTTFTMDEVIALYLGILPAYRARGSWIFGSTAYAILATMKTGEGNYIWSPSTQTGMPDRLLGKPCFEDAGYDATGTVDHEVATFGDMSAFWVRYCGPLVIEASEAPTWTSFETTWRAALWMDSDLMDTTAIGCLKMAAS